MPRKDELLKVLEEQARTKRENKLRAFTPYPKQREFFALGATKRERLFSAGNQLGKSEAGAAEMAYHLTGRYPDDWTGRRFDHPVKAWAAGEGGLVVRDVQQRKLCGEPGLLEAFGTGFIPKSAFVGKPSMGHGVTDAFDTIHVRHIGGGTSVLKFKSYEQGRSKFQADTCDVIWLDEEPDMEIYTECLTRTNDTGGIVYVTFTPLKGKTALYVRFTEDRMRDRGFVNMTIHDKPMPEERRQQIIDSYPAHERAARVNGAPMQGSGRVFLTPEEDIAEPAIKFVPPHWFKLWSIDFGINHPFAAVLSAWDKDADVIHILSAYRASDQTPLQHAAMMKYIAVMVPVAWPHDGNQRERGSGEALSKLYKAQGLKMCDQHATFADGGYSTEAGILDMDDRLKTGRLRVAAHLAQWFEEYRDYHRKDGLIVKERDDIMSATRIGVMARRFGRPVLLGSMAPSAASSQPPRMAQHAELSGDDLF
jgi:phage terminase large subunit-like protein